jgi:outer membrane protein assembly factor BamD
MKMNSNRHDKSLVWRHAAARMLVAVLAGAVLPACLFHRHRNQDVGAAVAPGDQPDKILYQKASREIAKGRYDVGRLTLQTLINTYPDSEYLAKAKLAVADSYYQEGGVSGLTQAEAEYKDFITFFPTAPEAPMAQFRVGMAHFRLMGKSDRDLSEARAAQAEFKAFLEKYPDSEVMPRVKGRLREVQEVLAQGNYQTAKLYFERGANRAASSRFQEIADSYPNFSQADRALWYLGQSLERLHKGDDATIYYARIITDYPLSPSVRDAKTRLVAMHKPIPEPNKAVLARAQADRIDAKHQQRSVVAKATGVMSSSPDLSATRHGPVQLGEHPGVQEARAQSPSPATATIAVQTLPDPASDPPAAKNSNDPNTPDASDPPAAKSSNDPNTPDASDPSAAKSSDAASSEPASSDPAKPSTGTQQASVTTASNGNQPAPDPSAEKKGKLHFLKKLIPL